jgi:hypothetical protein
VKVQRNTLDPQNLYLRTPPKANVQEIHTEPISFFEEIYKDFYLVTDRLAGTFFFLKQSVGLLVQFLKDYFVAI